MDISYSSFPKYFFKILQFITAYPDSCFNIFIVPQKKVLTEKYFTKGKLEHSLQTEPLWVIPFSEVFSLKFTTSVSQVKAMVVSQVIKPFKN